MYLFICFYFKVYVVTHIKYITLAEEQAVQKQYQNLRTKIQNNARQRGKKQGTI